MSHFYLEPIRRDKLPEGVALSAFVKTSGDTVGVVYVQEAGGFALWRDGSCIGTYDTLKSLYRKLERVDA